jgi:hypothetical protein
MHNKKFLDEVTATCEDCAFEGHSSREAHKHHRETGHAVWLTYNYMKWLKRKD